MTNDLESLALAIEGFIAAGRSKAAKPPVETTMARVAPRTGRERPPTKDEIYDAYLNALSVDERASLASILGKMHRAIGNLPVEILEPRRQRRP